MHVASYTQFFTNTRSRYNFPDTPMEKWHTPVLIRYLRCLRRAKTCDDLSGYSSLDLYDVQEPGLGLGWEIVMVKGILAGREHVPNKVERKLIRQQKAKRAGSGRSSPAR